jgi:cell division protein FtsN
VALPLTGVAAAALLAGTAGGLGSKPQALAVPAAPPPVTAVTSAPSIPRATYALELGPFATATAAERAEYTLGETDQPTVRVRQGPAPSVYTVLVEDAGSERQARALVVELRAQGHAAAALVGESPPFAISVAQTQPRRSAVQIGAVLRALGHRVRLVGRPGGARSYVVRHGAFSSERDAEARAAELAARGLDSHVVRVE